MSVTLYDEAITKKLSKWVLDPKVKILKPDETQRLFEMKADQKNDEPLTLPLIAISRHRNIEILNTQKCPMTYNGITLMQSSEDNPEKISIPLNAIPIKLGYQIDIYARFMEEADEYLRNFVFNLINHPKLIITIPYNDVNFKHKSIINIDPSLNDNSDIKEHLFADQFTRFTINIYIEDAYMFSAPIVKNTVFDGFEVWIHEKGTDTKDDYLVASGDSDDEASDD